jgi:Ca-activated chloride channel family protein
MLVEQIGGTLVTIAKDVKIQVEFNPALVAAYRLIGYENRMLRDEDFNDDAKDAGEIGAGHTVTALYEIVPAGVEIDLPPVDDLKYQTGSKTNAAVNSGELLTLKIRYKDPEGDTSRLLTFPVVDDGLPPAAVSDDFRFAAAVASFGMILRESDQVGSFDLQDAAALARDGLGPDRYGYREEFVELVELAGELSGS